MNELDQDARAFLASARGAHDAPDGAKDRVRAGLAVALSASAGAGAALPRAIARGPWLTAVKIASAVAIVGTGAGVLFGLTRAQPARDASPPPSPPSVALAPSPAPMPTPSLPRVPAVTVAAEPVLASSPLPPPLPLPKPDAKPAVGSGSGGGGSGGSVAAEVAILRRVSAALRSGDPKSALAAVGEHARRFPNGALAEERDMERVVALCALGRRDEAARATERFERAYPASAHEARIRAACASPGVAP